MSSRRSCTVGTIAVTIAAPDGSLTNSERHRRTAWSSLKSNEGIRLSERPVYSFRKRVVWTTCRPVMDEFWAFRSARSHRGSNSSAGSRVRRFILCPPSEFTNWEGRYFGRFLHRSSDTLSNLFPMFVVGKLAQARLSSVCSRCRNLSLDL